MNKQFAVMITLNSLSPMYEHLNKYLSRPVNIISEEQLENIMEKFYRGAESLIIQQPFDGLEFEFYVTKIDSDNENVLVLHAEDARPNRDMDSFDIQIGAPEEIFNRNKEIRLCNWGKSQYEVDVYKRQKRIEAIKASPELQAKHQEAKEKFKIIGPPTLGQHKVVEIESTN